MSDIFEPPKSQLPSIFNQRQNETDVARQVPNPVDSYAGNPGIGPNYSFEDHTHELINPNLSGTDAQRLTLITSSLLVPTFFYDTVNSRNWEWNGVGWCILSEPTQDWSSTIIVSQVAARTKTVIQAKVARANGWCRGTANLTITQAGTLGNYINVNSPYTGAYSNQECGSFLYLPTVGNSYTGTLDLEPGPGLFYFWVSGGAALGVGPSYATVNGDKIFFNFNYEMASRYS